MPTVEWTSMRSTLVRMIVAVTLLVAGCGGGASDVSPPPALSAVQLETFCARYEEVRNLARLEMLTDLVDVAPFGSTEVLQRTSQRGADLADEDTVDALLDRCDQLKAEQG